MKKWAFLLVCLLLVGLCVACGEPEEIVYSWVVDEPSDRVVADILEIRITDDSNLSEQISYEIVNPTESAYAYGYDYDIEVLLDGVWHKMHNEPLENISVPAGEYRIDPGKTMAHKDSWWASLAPGTYRILIEMELDEDVYPNEPFFIAKEFVVE